MVTLPASSGLRLFYSYSHKDEAFREKLETHFGVLRGQGLLSEWHDRKIVAGTPWREMIDRNLEIAHIILLLISPDFLASPYCFEVETTRALQRHQIGTARVIPVILRPASWQTAPFAELQVVPTGAKAVVSWTNQDEALADVAEHIRRACDDIRQVPGDPSNPLALAEVGDWVGYETRHLVKPTGQRSLLRFRQEVIEKNDRRVIMKVDSESFRARTIEILIDRPLEDIVPIFMRQQDEPLPPDVMFETKERGAGTDKIIIGEHVYYTTWKFIETRITQGLDSFVVGSKMWFSPDVPLFGMVKQEQDNPVMSQEGIVIGHGRRVRRAVTATKQRADSGPPRGHLFSGGVCQTCGKSRLGVQRWNWPCTS